MLQRRLVSSWVEHVARCTRRQRAETFCDVLSVERIQAVREAALRRGVWFRALSRMERGILDITTKYVDCIRSAKLAKIVMATLNKLKLAIESKMDRLVRLMGVPRAQEISRIAVGWGYRSASNWADDHGFARFLAVNFSHGHAVK